ncbi:PREDICTED: putative pentatricopeptide repeat-containing protein At1g17630 [Tarenaya hassleriana]|uniref:putative pentatricopeptide repeat-containing protein At1g17630 n=1 Tax=Tarenaya hassleriana TaxID=28532 RepID=UPI00053C1D85|nr:PREDICTED: putative pentatricopeptide repeat-containing protein At1g17630 [Tarenaya hassleriana]
MLHVPLWRFRLQPITSRLYRCGFCVWSCSYTSLSSPTMVSGSSSCSVITKKTLFDFIGHVLQRCITVHQCRQVHAQVIASDMMNRSGFLAARLVSVYSESGLLLDARNVFEGVISSLVPSDLLLWNSILRAYIYHGSYEVVLQLYAEMRKRGVLADGFTFPLILRACRFLDRYDLCRILHNHVIQMTSRDNPHVENELLLMYSKMGKMRDAYNLFVKMSVRDQISWNSMISGFSLNYDCDSAVRMVEWMQSEGFEPNEATLTPLLSSHRRCGRHEEVIKCFDVMRTRGVTASGEALAVFFSACADLGAFRKAEKAHGYAIKGGFVDYLPSKNALILVYGKQGKVKEAEQVFCGIVNKTIESWNSLMTSFVEAGLPDEALSVFSELEEMSDPLKVKANVITWTSIIRGCATRGRGMESLELFRKMQFSNVLPNSVTVCCILSTCAELTAFSLGREVHGHIIRTLAGDNILVQNGLVNMYMKCGSLSEGDMIFEVMTEKDLTSWNTMISGYGIHGHGERALGIFDQMIKAGFCPDDVTLIAVLSACSHAGLVKEGREIFYSMSKEFGIEPQVQHYACIVDMLGRAGFLKEASEILKSMPIEPNTRVWGALLNSCRMHNNMDLVEEPALQLFSLESEMAGNYMLLSNIYSAGGRWEESAKIRALAKTRDLKKVAGSSWIEVKKKVYVFSAGAAKGVTEENELPRIYQVLEVLICNMWKNKPTLDVNLHEENLDIFAE